MPDTLLMFLIGFASSMTATVAWHFFQSYQIKVVRRGPADGCRRADEAG